MSFSFFLQSELKSYGGARLDENSVRKKKAKEREVSKEVNTCNRLIHFVNIKREKFVRQNACLI